MEDTVQYLAANGEGWIRFTYRRVADITGVRRGKGEVKRRSREEAGGRKEGEGASGSVTERSSVGQVDVGCGRYRNRIAACASFTS